MPGNDVINPLPDANLAIFNDTNTNFLRNELPAILRRYKFSAFVFSGGIHWTGAGKISASFAVDAFSSLGNRITADGFDGSVAIDYGTMGASDDDLAYVIASAQTGDTLGNFQRVEDSNYFVNCVDIPSSPPLLPDDSVWLMEVIISGGNISAIRDIRNLHPLGNALVNVKDFGATGTGATNDRIAIQNAFAASKTVFFPEGDYYVGHYTTGEIIIDLSLYGNGIRIKTEGIVTISCSTTGAGVRPDIFRLDNNNDFYCEPICFLGVDTDLVDITGPNAFGLTNMGNISWGNITFENIKCVDMISGITTYSQGGNIANRIHGINIGQLNIENCYYGLNCQNDGDNIFGTIIASYCVKPYFVWGVWDHVINMFNKQPIVSTGQCSIATLPDSNNTRGITVNYTCHNSDATFNLGTHVSIEHTDLIGHEISGIKVHVNIHDSIGPYYPVVFRNYTGSGGAETILASNNIVRDIQLSGSCDANALPVQVIASYATKGQMHFIPGLNFFPSPGILGGFKLCQMLRDQVDIIWGATTTDPILGDGILTYDMDIIDGMAFVAIHLTIGATTNAGDGDWTFSGFLSSTYVYGAYSIIASQGSWYGVDTIGELHRCGVCFILPNGSTIKCISDGSATLVGSFIPHAWAAGDTLNITIAFPLS